MNITNHKIRTWAAVACALLFSCDNGRAPLASETVRPEAGRAVIGDPGDGATGIGRPPRYKVRFEFSKTRYTLNIFKHLEFASNAFVFEVPVDKAFYDSVSPGDKIEDFHRKGLMYFSGDVGLWVLEVVSKTTE